MESEAKTWMIVMRHGERADWAYDPEVNYTVPMDPCLTTKGKQQAFMTGTFLKTQFGLDKRKVYIYSSPLLRTMESAAQVVKALGLTQSHHIIVSDFLIEELSMSYFPENPQTGCVIRTTPHEVVRDTLLDHVEFEDSAQPTLSYPENDAETAERCHTGYSSFIKKHEQEAGSAVILVGHGRIVDEFDAFFGMHTVNLHYCAVSAASLIGSKWQLPRLLARSIVLITAFE